MTDLSRIETILVDEDPEGLLSLGAPRDEYEGEAAQIAIAYARLLPTERDADHALQIVVSVFAGMFGLDGAALAPRLEVHRRIAQRIAAGSHSDSAE